MDLGDKDSMPSSEKECANGSSILDLGGRRGVCVEVEI